ncbi:hypothetical protein RHMOL_Rhmol01G0287900 [Rhododendron molle]|uniref:Uncharacterized protein n=1 Tax=Rhododendron molle TaxID=49168 RepID=A0ACC0Q8M2_RHOML|nr:hypothetical protein RHMOL_Rhmol01G0287900 [Rhododendron molle]
MGRAPCCDKDNVKRGPWSAEEDSKLKDFIHKYGTGGNWISLPQKAGLKRCGKSCRLRWLNYLRPNIKHGEFSDEEDRVICTLFATIGSRWSVIAANLPGRTDNDIKNYWNTKLKKKLMGIAIQSNQTEPQPIQIPHPQFQSLPTTLSPIYTDFGSSYNTNPFPNTGSLIQTPESFFSSSDGSYSQISYGRDVKQEEMCFQSFFPNGYEENQKFMIDFGNNIGGGDENLSSWNDDQKPNGYFGNSSFPVECDPNSYGSNGFSLFNDESRTQQRSLYYY